MNRDTIEAAAFAILQKTQNADFDALMAYKYGQASALKNARIHLADALAIADAALSEAAVEGEDA